MALVIAITCESGMREVRRAGRKLKANRQQYSPTKTKRTLFIVFSSCLSPFIKRLTPISLRWD